MEQISIRKQFDDLIELQNRCMKRRTRMAAYIGLLLGFGFATAFWHMIARIVGVL